jgi:creatine kinase
MTWGEVDESDSKNTDDFKYKKYSEAPKFGDEHKSLMAKHLTPELFDKLKDVKTSKGYTLSNAIQTGVMTPHLGVGATAGDEEAWTVFKDLYNPIIKGWHKYDPETQKHVSDLNPENVQMDDATAELFNKYVKSTRIRAARNISGFALPAGATDEERNGVRKVLEAAFGKFEGDLAGKFFDLETMSPEDAENLRSKGFLFQKPKPTNLLTYCGAARSWPKDRGIFHNESQTALAWCNEEDQ